CASIRRHGSPGRVRSRGEARERPAQRAGQQRDARPLRSLQAGDGGGRRRQAARHHRPARAGQVRRLVGPQGDVEGGRDAGVHQGGERAVIDLGAVRAQFPALARRHGDHPMIHLDGPAGSQVPRSVIEAVADTLAHHNANSHGLFPTSRESGAIDEDARRCAADLFGAADPDCVLFGPNATTLLFALSRSVGRTLGGDDEIVVTQLDHDANVTPWLIAAREAGAGVKVARVRPEDSELDLDDLAAAVTPRTRLVAVTAASNATGALTPLARIAELAHAYGALLVVDAVHYAPHRLMDVAAWGCDAAVCSPYKFFGPHAGMMWGKRELLEQLPAYRVRPVGDALPYRWT